MLLRSCLVAVCLVSVAAAIPAAQSDLDALMARVLARRDDNWKKLQQYTLNERETLQITALAVFRLYGFDREYLWLPRAGFFVRSPLKADGVTIGDEARRRAEDRWLRKSQTREKRLAGRKAKDDTGDLPGEPCDIEAGNDCIVEPPPGPGEIPLGGGVEDIVTQSFEPEFIQSANFMRFKFDQGQYALAGREKMLDRDVLKVEYYPKLMFRGNDKGDQRREEDFENGMNKTSLVTLWIDPAAQQILRYEFRNVDMDFLPAQWLVRFDSMRATMQMAEPFPGVWLPASINMRFRMTLAAGPFEARYDVKYTDYRLAETSGRIVR
jgi:hypothetical protein